MTPLLIELGLIGMLVVVPAVLWRHRRAARQLLHRQTYRLVFPRGVKPEQLVGCLSTLAGRPRGREALVIESIGRPGTIEHRIRIPLNIVEFVQAQLRTALPGIRLEAVEDEPLAVTAAWSLWLTRNVPPLKVTHPEHTAAALLGSLGPLGKDEVLVVQWVLTPARFSVPSEPRPKNQQGTPWLLVDLLNGRQRSTPERRKQYQDKAAFPVFASAVRLGVATPDGSHRAKQLLARPLSVLRSVRNGTGDFWPILTASRRLTTRRLNEGRVPALWWPVLVNCQELAGLLGWPLGTPTVSGLSLRGAAQLAPSPMVPWRGMVFGTSSLGNRPVAISPTDALKHTYIIGPTGSGKSTLLCNLFHGVLTSGSGAILVDPKGDLANDALEVVPADRESDIIVLDPRDERPVTINLLDAAPGEEELVADQVVSTFAKRFSAYWGPRTSDVMWASVNTCLANPGTTLVQVPDLLTDANLRRRLVVNVHDPATRAFWQWYEHASQPQRADAIAPLLNKFRTTVLRPSVSRVVGQPSSFRFDDLLSQRKVLIVNLAEGMLGEDTAGLLGSLIIGKLWLAIQRRIRLDATARQPFVALLDEFQKLVGGNLPLGDMLALARGYGLATILAHQHLHQLPTELRHDVLANARTKVAFTLGARDAVELARDLAPHITPDDLRGLDAYEAVVSPNVGGQQLPPVNVNTPPPLEPSGRGAAIRALSQQRYGREPVIVEVPADDLDADEPPIGRRLLG